MCGRRGVTTVAAAPDRSSFATNVSNFQLDEDERAYAQALECLRKIEALTTAGGGSLANVVKLTVYLIDIADKDAVGRARRECLAPPYPASTLVAVQTLVFPELRVEIDALVRLDVSRDAAG